QLAVAAILCGLIPVLNALTTGIHLGYSLPAGEWVIAGFDLTMLGFAAFFAFALYRVRLRQLAPAMREASAPRSMKPAE
ncbi:MAG: hypothetical protein ACRCSW_15750, partial [Tabrizicola sp.]